MSATLDISQDYLIWDNTEAVTHRSKSNVGTVDTSVAVALGLAPSVRERAASGGAYTGQDKVWHLPVPLCPAVSAKPGDVILDTDGTKWTVLETSPIGWKTCWRLTCRNLVLAYGLRDRISIERAWMDKDDAGSPLKLWPPIGGETPYQDIVAKVQPVSVQPGETLGVRGTETQYLVIVEDDLTLTSEDRVNWNGIYLEIRGLRNPSRIDELPVLDCVRVP